MPSQTVQSLWAMSARQEYARHLPATLDSNHDMLRARARARYGAAVPEAIERLISRGPHFLSIHLDPITRARARSISWLESGADIHPCTLARASRVLHRRTVGTTPVPALPAQLASGNERTTATVNRSVAGSERQTTAFARRRARIQRGPAPCSARQQRNPKPQFAAP